MTITADEIVARLGLLPHPEGGCYRETYRHAPKTGGRGDATCIYYLLKADEVSHWHKVDAVEIWHHYAGAPLALRLSEDGRTIRTEIIGKDFAAGQHAHAVVPPHAWQSAASLGDWTLVGCTVAPAFDFAGFEMAPKGWEPG